MIALLVGTPREHVILSGSRAGQALESYFSQARLGIPKNRLFRGVLLLPKDHGDYLRGPRRHTLRTNLRKAATAGIRCELMPDLRRASDAVSTVLRQRDGLSDAELQARTNDFRAWVVRQEMTVMVARDQHGAALAVLAATIDTSVCAIGFAMATCHDARWALHDHLVRILIARRVRYLFSADEGPFGALAYPTNVQYYQHLLGYELRHVTPVPTHPAAPRRRWRVVAAVSASVAAAIVLPQAAEGGAIRNPPVSVYRAQLHESANAPSIGRSRLGESPPR